MKYITSRWFPLGDDARRFENEPRFNLWQRKLWPYEDLITGDEVYWYETTDKAITWRTRIFEIHRFEYMNKRTAKRKLKAIFRNLNVSESSYFVDSPDQGYCLAFKVKVIKKLNLPKPKGYKFPRLGWLRVDKKIAETWLSIAYQPTNDVSLDDLSPKGNVLQRIKHINSLMKGVSQERIASIVSHTVRKDTAMIKALKKLCGYRCQFPGCGTRITKRSGGYYIEVAHILPVSEGGRSTLGNLIVLCPNHHKELDYGKLKVVEQSETLVSGSLNGTPFRIELSVFPRDRLGCA